MVNKKGKTCWEYWNCPENIRSLCAVFQTNSGTDCWDLKDVRANACPAKMQAGITDCVDCPFFLKQNPGFEKEVEKEMCINIL